MQVVDYSKSLVSFPYRLIDSPQKFHHHSGEREFIRTEAVTEMLNQCRTAYYKDNGGGIHPPPFNPRGVGSDECWNPQANTLRFGLRLYVNVMSINR